MLLLLSLGDAKIERETLLLGEGAVGSGGAMLLVLENSAERA